MTQAKSGQLFFHLYQVLMCVKKACWIRCVFLFLIYSAESVIMLYLFFILLAFLYEHTSQTLLQWTFYHSLLSSLHLCEVITVSHPSSMGKFWMIKVLSCKSPAYTLYLKVIFNQQVVLPWESALKTSAPKYHVFC